MIDLLALQREAEGEGDTVVSRRWLRQVLAELTAGRAADAELVRLQANQGRVFGSREIRG